jgi:hypothetical protein
VDVESVENHFTVKENGTKIKGKIDVNGKFATFMPPNEKFEKNKTYTVELTEEIKDLAGNGLYPGKTWKFSTE